MKKENKKIKFENVITYVLSFLVIFGVISMCAGLFADELSSFSDSSGGGIIHSHTFEMETTYSNCSEGGAVRKYCTSCAYEKTTKSAPTEHSMVTVSEAGYTDYSKCIKCGYTVGKNAVVLLSGEWQFNKKILPRLSNTGIEIKFSSNGTEFSYMFPNVTGFNSLYYSDDSTGLMTEAYNYETLSWTDEAYRLISIKEPCYVREDFYFWFIANAQKITSGSEDDYFNTRD